jgi:hypothetical protein
MNEFVVIETSNTEVVVIEPGAGGGNGSIPNPLPIGQGGTSAQSASNARYALGVPTTLSTTGALAFLSPLTPPNVETVSFAESVGFASPPNSQDSYFFLPTSLVVSGTTLTGKPAVLVMVAASGAKTFLFGTVLDSIYFDNEGGATPLAILQTAHQYGAYPPSNDQVEVSIYPLPAPVATVTEEQVDDWVAGLLTPGAGISLSYNDPANTLTISQATLTRSANAPQASDGVNGGFWIQDYTDETVIYGPKAAGVWPVGKPIRSPFDLAATFHPDLLPGLLLFFNANEVATVRNVAGAQAAVGEAVQQWWDRRVQTPGAGLQQVTLGKQPILRQGATGGRYVEFSQVSQHSMLATLGYSLSGPVTVVYHGTISQEIDDDAAFDLNNGNSFCCVRNRAVGDLNVVLAQQLPGTWGTGQSAPARWVFHFSHSRGSGRRDGLQGVIGRTHRAGVSIDRLRLNAAGNDLVGTQSGIRASCVMMYNGTLTQLGIQMLETWMANNTAFTI